MRHRTDSNHAVIEAVFRRLLADKVTNISQAGLGIGDLVVSFNGFMLHIEIKPDAKAKETPLEIKFHRIHPGCVKRCESVEQAIEICKYVRAMGTALAARQIAEMRK